MPRRKRFTKKVLDKIHTLCYTFGRKNNLPKKVS